MKKLLLMAMAFLPMLSFAQMVIFSDDFESYNDGDALAASSPVWTTWSGGVASEDALISNDQSFSGNNSVHIEGTTTDLVLPFPSDYTTGVYGLSMMIYVVGGNGAYFNFQQSSTPGVNWMFEIYFDASGTGTINAGGTSSATFTYTPDSWTDFGIIVDLTNDSAEVSINSQSIYKWQWSLGATGTGAETMWGGMDIFATAPAGQTADFYIDDVVLSQIFESACAPPTGLTVGKVNPTAAQVMWNPETNATYYKVFYHPATVPQGGKKPATTTSKVLKNLTPDTKYKWGVQSVCGTQPLNESVITMGPDFTTPPMRFGEDVNTSFEVEVFPNPASENATISFSLDEESQVRIALMDVNGKLIKEIANSKYGEGIYQLSFNSKDLSSGVYLIQLTTNEELVSKKLVIER